VHDHLHKWDRTVLNKSKNYLRKTQCELENVVQQTLSPEVRKTELSEEIEWLLEMEEIHWAQRSRINWLQYGDNNTSYFHIFLLQG
jgi:hypothetical protein